MPLSPGFPTDFSEYITVWCADLLEPLSAEQRRQFMNTLAMSYEGGPWPSRLSIQRLVEQSLGLLDGDAAVGEVDLRLSGLDEIMARLHEPDLEHEWVVTQLSRLPGSIELVAAVDEAVTEGSLSPLDRELILGAALSRAILPEPISAPPAYPPPPPDHPESYDEYRQHNPGYEVVPPLDVDIQSALDQLVDMHVAGTIARTQFRPLQHELMNLGLARFREREEISAKLAAEVITVAESALLLKSVEERFRIPDAVTNVLNG